MTHFIRAGETELSKVLADVLFLVLFFDLRADALENYELSTYRQAKVN